MGGCLKLHFFTFPKYPHQNHASLIPSHMCLSLFVGLSYPSTNRKDMTFNSDFSQDMPHQTPYCHKNTHQNHDSLSWLFMGQCLKLHFFIFIKNPHQNHATNFFFFPILIPSYRCLSLYVDISYPRSNRQDMTFNSNFSQDIPHQTFYSHKNIRKNHASNFFSRF